MKKYLVLMLAMTALVLFLVGSHSATAQTQDVSAQAGKFITLLSGGEYKAAVGMFDETVKAALPKEKLEQVWQGLQAQCGAYQSKGDTRKEKIQQYDVVYVPCKFEKTALDCQIAFDSNGMIAGLHFLPSASK